MRCCVCFTSIFVRRPSHSFFSASISAFSAAMATVARGCYWRKTKLWICKKEKEQLIICTYSRFFINKSAKQRWSCSTLQFTAEIHWPVRASLCDPDILIWNAWVCCYTIKSWAKIRHIPDSFNPSLNQSCNTVTSFRTHPAMMREGGEIKGRTKWGRKDFK